MKKSMILISFLLFFPSIFSADVTKLIIVNNCNDPIWPAILPTAGHETLNDGGFSLPTSQQTTIDAPDNWSGRIWARTGCCFDEATGRGSCQTGDCGGQLNCSGSGGQPPATIVEMTLGTDANPAHYYDVSLVDGFNVPVSMIPVGAAACGVAACEADVNECCPDSLAVRKGGKVVGCKSACLATGADKYCCTGEYGSPGTCKPTAFANLFKALCPRAYSYAFDEATGLKTCKAKKYVITFCPPN
ncbi:hypothetical protein CASFOL_006584 [Castilleja foliolosa]|uniref:Thaumatin-like protein n=1 Tax=Castilleja foliolosa TaxID=1961234 RepID=A0ABD3E6V3_9LAMI